MKDRRQQDRSAGHRSRLDEEEPVKPDRRQSYRDSDADRNRRQQRDDRQDDRYELAVLQQADNLSCDSNLPTMYMLFYKR